MLELSGDDKMQWHPAIRNQASKEKDRDKEQNEFSISMDKLLHLSGYQLSHMQMMGVGWSHL